MRLFRKLAINMHSRVETLADRFENKEAVSNAYIQEYERVVARAKVKLSRVTAEVERLETEREELRQQVDRWAERARRVHATDESRALECVSRRNDVKAKQHDVERVLEETRGLRDTMARDVEQILAKLERLKRAHEHLSGRQVCAEAARALHHVDDSVRDEVDDVLSRWETHIVAQELHGGMSRTGSDTLDREFSAQEREASLRRDLNDLIGASERKEEERP